MSPKIRKEIKKNTGIEMAANARFSLKSKAYFRDKELVHAIKSEAKSQGKVLAASREFSELIRAGVRERLKIPPDSKYPSISKIKETISRIKNGTVL